MNPDSHTLQSEKISATIKGVGAELCSLRNAEGLELLGRQDRHGRAIHPCCFRSSAA
jgi:hypothetical protein